MSLFTGYYPFQSNLLLPNRFYIALRGLYDWWEYWKIADFARFINRLGDATEDYVPRLPGEPPRQASFRAAIYIVDQLPRLHLRRDRRIAVMTALIQRWAAEGSSAHEGLIERLLRAADELRHDPPAY